MHKQYRSKKQFLHSVIKRIYYGPFQEFSLATLFSTITSVYAIPMAALRHPMRAKVNDMQQKKKNEWCNVNAFEAMPPCPL